MPQQFTHDQFTHDQFTHDPLIIAHRGESHDAPENTLASVKLAWERGVTAVEVDVRATADNHIAVIHDNNTFRTTGQKRIISYSIMADLKRLDAGSWKGREWAGQKIPELSEVLATVPATGKLLVEIKSGPRILDQLHQVTEASGLLNNQIEIIANDLDTLIEARRRMTQYRMLWVIETLPAWRRLLTGMRPKAVIVMLGNYGIDGITIGDNKHLTRNFVHHLKAAGRPIYAWTVNDPVRAAKLLEFGIDGITTDRAAWMKQMLSKSR